MITTTKLSAKETFPSFFPISGNPFRLWIRELFVLFYFGMTGTALLAHFLPGFVPALLLKKGMELLCAPGMIFATGCLMSTKHAKEPGFRRTMLRYALTCILLFYTIGFFNEVIIHDRAAYATIKDLLALLRVPGLVSVLLSLSFLFLICACLWKQVESLFKKPALISLICVAGFLFAFLPFGILGYSLTGVLVGGDVYACIPLAQYLFVFFAGIFSGRRLATESGCCGETESLSSASFRSCLKAVLLKKTGLSSFLLIGLGGVMAFAHQNQAAKVLLGSGAAGLGILASILLFSIYEELENLALRLWSKILSTGLHIYERQKTSRPLALLLYFTVYTILFFVMAYFIFYPYIQENRTLIWSVDGLGQYIPRIHRFLSYIPSVFQDLLHGNLNFQQYDFSIGLGAPVAISYEPIYWLCLLFHPSQAETAYSALILLRYFLSGASMSVMLLYFKKAPYTAWTVSMVYAFCGYAIYSGTRHGQFLIPMMLLPVLVVAMEKLISEKKWYLLTILTAVSLLCSYYFLYMNTIALGIYFVTRILCTKEYRNFKTFFTRGLIIVGSYVLGASIGVISLFTSFGNYMGSSRTDSGGISDILTTTPLFYNKEWIPNFFLAFISDSFSPGMWLKLGFAPIALFAVILLFTRRKKNPRELMPIFLIFTLFCLFPIFGYIFSGFSDVTNRWCYIYAVIVAFVLAANMESMTALTARELKIILGLTGVYAGIIFFSTRYRTDKIFGVFGLLMLTAALLLAVNYKEFQISTGKAKAVIFFITMLSVILNANLFMTSKSETGTHMETYVEKGTSLARLSNTALQYLDQALEQQNISADDTFFRSTNLNTYGDTRSSSLIYGYNDISTFTSTLAGSIVDYNRAMGNCDWNIVSIYSYNFRTYMHELASIRFLGAMGDDRLPLPYGYEKIYTKKSKEKEYCIYENQYALPLGYTYDTVINEAAVEGLSAAEKQEATMLSAIVPDDSMKQNSNLKQTDSLPLTAKKIPVSKIKPAGDVTIKGDTITIGEGCGTLKIYFDGEAGAETYLSLKGDIYHQKDAVEHFLVTRVKAEDINYKYKFRIDSYTTNQPEFLFNLGYRDHAIDSCTLKFKNEGQIKFDEIAVYCQPMDTYARRVLALKEQPLKEIQAGDNMVTGNITVDSDKMLVLSLPYQKGWTAWVDGEKTEIQRVNYQYMGLNLTKGQHDIRLHYQLPGLKYAVIITLGGLGCFLAIILFRFLLRRKKQRSA